MSIASISGIAWVVEFLIIFLIDCFIAQAYIFDAWQRQFLRGLMKPSSPSSDGVIRVNAWTAGVGCFLNAMLALVLFVPASIVIGLIYLFLLVSERRIPRNFFYAGIRLGLHGKPYRMYKIRTLRLDSEFERQGVILQPGTGREMRFGVFLRESRLDELPQLWNVVRGDMNLVGPRPLRPELYEMLKKQMPHCDRRFAVKPGMTGYAQFLTPSHTPKRIRIAIDNHYVQQGSRPFRDLFLLGWTIVAVTGKTAGGLWGSLRARWAILKKRGNMSELRKLKRQRPRYAWCMMSDGAGRNAAGDPNDMYPIYDINYRAFSFISGLDLTGNTPLYFSLVGCKECETTSKKKRARCCGYVHKTYPVPDTDGKQTRYVIFYEPLSEIQRYFVDHYVLHETVA